MVGTIFIIIIIIMLVLAICCGGWALYRGYKISDPVGVLLGVILIVLAIGTGRFFWKNCICHECYHYYENAYCENCGNPSDYYKKTLICPDCNVEVDSNYCQNCGIPRDEIERKDDEKAETTLVCAECDTELSDKANFCPECGAAPNVVERDLICSNCGNELETEEQYCSECGTSLNH